MDKLLSKEEYPNSLGTQKLIDFITDWYSKRDKPIWDTTIINIATIVRNNIDKLKSNNDIVSQVYKDLRNLNLAIYYYLDSITDVDYPYIILYIPDYSKLPELFRKKLSPTEERIMEICSLLENDIQNKKDGDVVNILTMPLYVFKAGYSRELPYKQLYQKINNINSSTKEIKKVLTRRYMLISHIAIDYYLFNLIRDIRLLECYTGNIKQFKDLGMKLFKEECIPFNQYTHSLFGDNTRVKPLANKKKRDELVKLAQRTKWNLKSQGEIKSSISMYDPLLGHLLTQINY